MARRVVALGGNHTRTAKYKLCDKLADGDWDALSMKMVKDEDLELFPYRPLCYTEGEVCFGLEPADVRMVSLLSRL